MNCKEQIRLFVLYTYNRVNYSMFKEIMEQKYRGENYIREKWVIFQSDPMAFIVARDEWFLYDAIMARIKKEGYKG